MQRSDGQGLVEYALVLPVFLLITFGIMEFGFLFLQYSTIANAAREGARTGILPYIGGCKKDCIENNAEVAARVLTTGLDTSSEKFAVNAAISLDERSVSVTVVYTTELITGPVIQAVGGNPEIVLQSTATMNRE